MIIGYFLSSSHNFVKILSHLKQFINTKKLGKKQSWCALAWWDRKLYNNRQVCFYFRQEARN